MFCLMNNQRYIDYYIQKYRSYENKKLHDKSIIICFVHHACFSLGL